MDRVNCQILESKPGWGQRSSYASVRTWAATRRLVPLRVEKYLASGELARRIDSTKVATGDNHRPIPANLTVRGRRLDVKRRALIAPGALGPDSSVMFVDEQGGDRKAEAAKSRCRGFRALGEAVDRRGSSSAKATVTAKSVCRQHLSGWQFHRRMPGSLGIRAATRWLRSYAPFSQPGGGCLGWERKDPGSQCVRRRRLRR